MALYLDEQQVMLRDAAHGFLSQTAPVSHMRELRASGAIEGFSRIVWKKFADMGFAAVLIPEADGGMGLGHTEAGIILEEVGYNLTPSPLLATGVGGVVALSAAAAGYRDRWYPAIASGEAIISIGMDETGKHAPDNIKLRANRSGSRFRLRGSKKFVPFGHVADRIIVTARTSGEHGAFAGITLFLIDPAQEGVRLSPQRLLDGSVVAHIELEDLDLPEEAVIGEIDAGWPVLSKILDAQRLGAAAELIGVARLATELTLHHLKERLQFGAVIGSFQALQHRAAHLHAELEVARASVLKAQRLLDENDPGASDAVSVAKAMAGMAATLAVQEGVQMHGGIGMTDEHDIGLAMKRVRVLDEMLGDANYHVDLFARHKGY